MSGWDRVRVPRSRTRFGRNSTMGTVQLGRVTPQAPGHRTIYCNDRDANQPVRFKVYSFSHFLFPFYFFNVLELAFVCLVGNE